MSRRNSSVLILVGALLGLAATAGDDDAPAAPARAQQAVLLFRNGRILEGELIETDTSYVILRRVGRIEVAREEVETVCKDREEAFRYRRSRINDRDPAEHVRLAEWCLVADLRQHAVEELECAAELSPDATRLRALARNVAQGAGPDRRRGGVAAAGSDQAPSAAAGRSTAERLELAPAAIASFTLQVQPLLQRSCGTGGCHAEGHSGSFVLERSPRATPRVTHQNLRSVLALLDPDDPEHSPLLVQSLTPHGSATRPPFAASVKDPSYATLSGWVRRVLGRPANRIEAGSPTGPGDPTTAATLQGDETVPGGTLVPFAGSTEFLGLTGSSTPRTAADSGTAAPYQPVDPFDPEIFNRQFARRSADP